MKQRIGHKQHAHPQKAGQCTEVHGLAQRTPYLQRVTCAALLRPEGEQGLENSHQRGIDADKNGRPNGESGHCIIGIAAGNNGVRSAKGHERQLPRQNGSCVAAYVLQLRLH